MNKISGFSIIGLCTIGFAASAVPPTDYDQYLLELINRGRANPVAEAVRYGISDLNEGVPSEDTISTAPKPPLAFHPALIDAAHGHSLWMLNADTFSHTGEGGSSLQDRIEAAGYPLSGSWGIGENIGWKGSSGTLNPTATVETLHRNLFVDENYDGRGHRLNLMNASMKEIGCGVEFGVFTQNSADYNAGMVTEDMARSTGSNGGNSFFTGIAWDDIMDTDAFYTPGEGLSNVLISATSRDSLITYTTHTWGSGGYSLAAPPGTYDITASGGELGGTAVTNNIVIGLENLKIDFTPVMLFPDAEVAVYATEEILNGQHSPSRTRGTDFGSSGLNRPAARQTFMIRNLGSLPLTISSPTLPTGFILVEGPDASIPAGGFDTFTVRLDASTAGTQKGIIGFSTNDPDEPLFTFTVTGRININTGLALIRPISDIPETTDFTSTSIDLLQHFDETGIDGTVVEMPSDLGTFYIEMTDIVTPITVQNFLNYVEDGDYIDSFIHRSLPGFVVQGGGFTFVEGNGVFEVPTDAAITNEFVNWFDPHLGALTTGSPVNVRGTLSMAKTGNDPNSATSQFFVNLADNSANLDNQNEGFTVFAEVLYDGMAASDAIAALPTVNAGSPFDNLPVRDFTSGTIYSSNVVKFAAPAVVPEMTLSIISNSNPSLMNAMIDSTGHLQLQRLSGAGISAITIQCEDLNGNTIEETFRISIAAPGDTDGDDYSDFEEFIADTNPTDSNDYFTIAAFNESAIQIYSSADRQYSLLFNTNLISGSWLPVPEQTEVMGTGNLLNLSSPSINKAGYFKVEVSIPK